MGTKKITSRAKASIVDLKLAPMDCNNIDIDLIKQVRMIPPKNIFKQYRAYSKYSKELPLPKILMINVGKHSNKIKAIKPINKLINKISLIVSFTLLIFPAPIL